MRLKVYSIYDVKVCAYSTPYFSPNDSVALRNFQLVGKDSSSQLYHFPGDFKLYRIGEFDDSSGLLTHEVPPALISHDLEVEQ